MKATKATFYAALTLLVTAGNGEAQTDRLPRPKLAPGQVVETISPKLTAGSTVHYQAMLRLQCLNGTSCFGDFPIPGTKRRLNITRMACALYGSAGSTFNFGGITLFTPASVALLEQYMPTVFSSSAFGLHTLNNAVDILVGSYQHIRVTMSVASGSANIGVCNATGTLIGL